MRLRTVPLPFMAAVLVATTMVQAGCGGGDSPSQGERTQAVGQAQVAFHQAQQAGTDLSAGPCISESVPGLSDWVVDVAHDPRQEIDDDPANQCRRFRDGEAHHFVELTPDGQLIRAE